MPSSCLPAQPDAARRPHPSCPHIHALPHSLRRGGGCPRWTRSTTMCRHKSCCCRSRLQRCAARRLARHWRASRTQSLGATAASVRHGRSSGPPFPRPPLNTHLRITVNTAPPCPPPLRSPLLRVSHRTRRACRNTWTSLTRRSTLTWRASRCGPCRRRSSTDTRAGRGATVCAASEQRRGRIGPGRWLPKCLSALHTSSGAEQGVAHGRLIAPMGGTAAHGLGGS